MAKLKMKKTASKKVETKAKKKTVRTEARKGQRGGSTGGGPRECGVCHKLGHNRRSHGPGGKLSKK